MKFILKLSLACLAICSTLSCSKIIQDDYTATYNMQDSSDAYLKIIYASAYTTNPSVQVSVDDVRVSGLITQRTPFPGGGLNTGGSNFPDYLALKPGMRKVSIAIPKRNTNIDSIVLYSTQVEVKALVRQSLHVMDTFTRTKSVRVEDDISEPAAGKIRYRFVNLMPNANSVDLYYGTVRVATGAIYNTPGIVFEMPTPPVNDTWTIRETGQTTALATYLSASSIVNRRVFTAFAMGYKGSTATNTRPYISFAINR